MNGVAVVPVSCTVCGRRLRGYPTVRGGYAVSRHIDRDTGRKCSGFFVHAHPVNVRVAS